MLILKMSVIFVEALQTVSRELQRHLSFVDNDVLIFQESNHSQWCLKYFDETLIKFEKKKKNHIRPKFYYQFDISRLNW